MNIIKYISGCAVLLTISISTIAQFSLSGEFRPRTEFSHGYKSPAAEGQDWSSPTTQRTRLNFGYLAEGLNTRLVLQDVRYWGNQPQLVANQDFATSVHEAWAEVKLAPDFFLRAGRQELVYDDQRILGNVGWAQQARSHDVAVLKLEKDFRLHLGIAHHENGALTNNLYNGPDAYKNLQFMWFNRSWEKSALSLLLLNNGVPVMENGSQVTKYGQTYGGRVTSKTGEIALAANLYGQSGENVSGKKISAVNLLFEVSLKNRFTAGYEYLSGNSYDKNDKEYAFNPLYGTNHKFNGFMDYFYVGNHIGSFGLSDGYLKFSQSGPKTGFSADIHLFSSAGKITAEADRYLGTEIDLTLTHKLGDFATLTTGWSTMFAGESMVLLKGGDQNAGHHWAYLMLTVTPVFIR